MIKLPLFIFKAILQIVIFIAGIFTVQSQTLYGFAQLDGTNNSDELASTNVDFATTPTTTLPFVASPLAVSPLQQVLVEKLNTSDKINLDLFVMSQCPFGVRAEQTIIPLLAEFGKRITIKFHYVATIDQNHQVQSMHGKAEVDEDQRQIIIGHLYPNHLLEYLLARAQNYQSNDWKSVAKSVGISAVAIEKMMQSREGSKLFLEDIQTSIKEKIFSSPTLFIDGQNYGGRIIPASVNNINGTNINSVLSINSVNADQCTAAPDGTTCTDANACTSIDFCFNGTCVGTAPLVCNDGNPNTIDICNTSTGCVSTPAGGISLNTDYFRSIITGNWNSPNTWESSPVADFSSGVVSPATLFPDNNAATITITSGNTVTVTASLATDETIVQSGATLVVNSGLTVNDGIGTDLDVNGIFNLAGTIDGAGLTSINSGATFTWSTGQMGGSGTTSILFGANAQVTGGVYMFGSRTLNNASSSFALSGGSIALSSAADVINNTGIILLQGDLQGDYGFLWNGGGTINNSGTITKTSGNGISYIYNNPTGTSFNNTGIVNVNIGTIEINAGGTHTGTFNVAAKLVFKSGTQVLSSTSSVSGTGSILNATSLTLDAGCTYAATVSFNQNSGTVDWNISSGTVNSFTLSGGGLQGGGVLNIANTFTGSGGQMLGSGTTSILSGANAQITGGVYMFGSRTLNNASSSFALSGGNIALSSAADVINNTGIILLQGDYGFLWNGGGTINNSGTITKTNGDGISYLYNNPTGTSFNNTGSVIVNSGTIEINANGTNAGSYSIASGKTLTGNFPSPFTGSSINNNGNITLSALTFKGTSVQSLNGIGKINYLTIDNANGVTLGGNQTINNALTLTNGVISTGANKLIVGSAATIARTNGWVNSNLELPFSNTVLSKTFFIGDATNYTPVLLSFNSITGPGSVLGSQTTGIHPNLASSTISGTKRVNRYYSLTPAGSTFDNYNYDATFNYMASDVLNSANTAKFIVGKFNPITWTYPTVGTKAITSTQITGVTSFSDFQIGEPCLAPSISGQPLATQTICQNTTPANLSVTATGDGLTYKWYADNNNTGFDGTFIASATNSSFTPPNATAGTFYYYAVVTGDCGIATSNYATVTVNPLFTWYYDNDLDGFGNPTNSTTTCSSTAPAGYVSNSTDCDDTKATYADNDGDGFGAGPKTPCGVGNNTDCNDYNASVKPGAAEICGNGIDDNCNGLIDENCTGCSNATDISTSNITSSSATLNWKAKANPTQWQVQYKTTKLGSMWVDVFATGDKRSITLLNLAAKQDYKWNIRAKCGNKWLSYSESIAFRTLAGTAASRTVISTEEKPFRIITYPNPTNGNFKIAVKGLENKLTSNVLVEIENGYGQLVYSKRVENINGIIDVTMDRKVAAGIYLVHCIVNGTNVTKKIVIGREL